MRATYVLRDGEFIERRSGERLDVPVRAEIPRPMLMRDIPAYASPIDGRMITSRSERREDLKRNNCVEWEPGMGSKPQPKNPQLREMVEKSRCLT